MELQVEQAIHEPITHILEDLQSEGKLSILSISGHKGFVFGYKVNLLIPNITQLLKEEDHISPLFEGEMVKIEDVNELIEERAQALTEERGEVLTEERGEERSEPEVQIKSQIRHS